MTLQRRDNRHAYTGSRAFWQSCRHGGDCPWCKGRRSYRRRKGTEMAKATIPNLIPILPKLGDEAMPTLKTLTNALDRYIAELDRLKVLAMRLERRPGAYYVTLENGTKELLCNAVYTFLSCVKVSSAMRLEALDGTAREEDRRDSQANS